MKRRTPPKRATTKGTALRSSPPAPARLAAPRASGAIDGRDTRFVEVIALIDAARGRAYQAVNTELVAHYWELGEYLSRKIASAEWGDGVVEELAADLARRYSGTRGYTRPNLFRMRQFYEAYRSNESVSPLVRLLPWTHHLIILSQARPVEAREFYIVAAIRERWSKRELERQIRTGAVLRESNVLKKVSPAVRQVHPGAAEEFKNAYNVEFLGLAAAHSEADLHDALLRNLGRFLTELGRDFCFVGSEYPVQVGHQDFAIDRRPPLRDEGRRGRRVRARADDVTDARRRVSDVVADEGAAPREAPRALRAALTRSVLGVGLERHR